MFGDRTAALQRALVEAWNELARARGEPIYYVVRNRGFRWVVELFGEDIDGNEAFTVALCGTLAEAKELVRDSVNGSVAGLRICNGQIGLYGLLDGENLGVRLRASDLRARMSG